MIGVVFNIEVGPLGSTVSISLVVGKGIATNEVIVSMVDVSLEDVKEGCWIVAIDMMLFVVV